MQAPRHIPTTFSYELLILLLLSSHFILASKFPSSTRRDLIPSEEGPVVANGDEDAAVPGEPGLPDGRVALGVAEHGDLGLGRVGHVQVPHEGLADLVAQGQGRLAHVHAEADEPEKNRE